MSSYEDASTSSATNRGNRNSGVSRYRQANRGRQHNQNRQNQSGSHSRHPPHLKGKEIGMYYRKLSLENPNRDARCYHINVSFETMFEVSKLIKIDPITDDSTQKSVFMKTFEKITSTSIEEKIEQICRENSNFEQNLQMETNNQITLNPNAKPIDEFRKKLPAYKYRSEILEAIENNQIVVISGETGCGKTTQLPQYILEQWIERGRGESCNIICTQPRRISAISVAERVRYERGDDPRSVGYQIRLEKDLPRGHASILFCTTGILLKRFVDNPLLLGTSHVILDEIHERDIHVDFAATLLKFVMKKRPQLKVILMSATLNAERFSQYFDNCPCVHIPGFTFPVEEFYLEDVVEKIRFEFEEDNDKPFNAASLPKWKKHTKRFKNEQNQNQAKITEFTEFIQPYLVRLREEKKYSLPTIRSLASSKSEDLNHTLIFKLIQFIMNHYEHRDGAILVFLPGIGDIRKVNDMICDGLGGRVIVVPLHSQLPTVNQRIVFDRPPKGQRKIILSTQIAETSITIEDVEFVIDCGKIKYGNFSSETNIDTLLPSWVSKANSRQRRGRAGRTKPGVCFYLYTRHRAEILDDYIKPELLRSRLEEVILQIKILQLGKVIPFLERVMDTPDIEAVNISLKLLQNLKALDENERLTPLGYHLAQLPVHPQCGKMLLLACIFGCVDPILSIVVTLSYRDPFYIVIEKEQEQKRGRLQLDDCRYSDHLSMVELFRKWDNEPHHALGKKFFVSESIMRQLNDMKRQVCECLFDMKFLSSRNVKDPNGNRHQFNLGLLRGIICAGLYPNVCQVRPRKYETVANLPDNQRGLFPKLSACSLYEHLPSPFAVYFKKVKLTGGITLFDGSVIPWSCIVLFADDLILDDPTDTSIIWGCWNFLKFKVNNDEAFGSGVKVFLEDLRRSLRWVVERKFCDPHWIDWTRDSVDADIIKGVLTFLDS